MEATIMGIYDADGKRTARVIYEYIEKGWKLFLGCNFGLWHT